MCPYVRRSFRRHSKSRGPCTACMAFPCIPPSWRELHVTIAMRRACMYSYSSLLLASSYVATGRVSAFTLSSSSVVHPAPATAAVARDIMTTPSGLAMVRNRGLEIPEEGATPLRKCFYFDLSWCIVLVTIFYCNVMQLPFWPIFLLSSSPSCFVLRTTQLEV